MAGLIYREDLDQARARLTTWWDGGDLGRPALQLTVPREKPLPAPDPMPAPPDCVPWYTTRSFEFRVNFHERGCAAQHYLAEAVPAQSPDLGANCLALYLGCRGVEANDTVWFEPFLSEPTDPDFRYDPDNFYWRFTLRLARELARVGRGKYVQQFPDLIEGLDTLAAMRGTEELLYDLSERPEWVQKCLRQITDRYFHYYDILYDIIRDEVGGSVFWAWAPGRMAKFQCDFSAMIGPEMFGQFMVPVLREMCERVSYCMYHWDGPGAIPHHDHLLSIPALKAIQWTPGAGTDQCLHRRWWPLYHKTIEAGKGVYIGIDPDLEGLKAMKKEFGRKFHRFFFVTSADSLSNAEKLIATVTG